MVMDMTSLKAVEEPMLMRPKRQAMVVLTAMEKRGIDVRGSTWRAGVNTPFLQAPSGKPPFTNR